MSTRNVTENLSAHMAVRDLLDRYTNALNQRDWAGVEAVFATDGVWDAAGPEMGENAARFEGAANCAKGIAELLKTAELCVQSNHAVTIDIDGARAKATSTINELILMKDAPGMMVVWGTYYDNVVKGVDGEWRFKQRTFRATWIDLVGAKGQVLTKFPLAKRPG